MDEKEPNANRESQQEYFGVTAGHKANKLCNVNPDRVPPCGREEGHIGYCGIWPQVSGPCCVSPQPGFHGINCPVAVANGWARAGFAGPIMTGAGYVKVDDVIAAMPGYADTEPERWRARDEAERAAERGSLKAPVATLRGPEFTEDRLAKERRERIATAVLQGFASRSDLAGQSAHAFFEQSVKWADDLIAELDK